MGHGAVWDGVVTWDHLLVGGGSVVHLVGDEDCGLRKCVASELLAYRKEYGLSQERFAQMLRISVRSYIDLEHGVSLPSSVTLLRWFLLMDEQEMLCFLDIIEECLP